MTEVAGAVPGDSAGRPWAGRAFETNPWGDDDGSAPHGYVTAYAALQRGEVGPAAVVESLRGARLLVPLLAAVGETGRDAAGRVHDKRAELSVVTVAGPDGRPVLPAFTCTDAMRAWNPRARPVPAPARQVALGAAGDGTELVILDAASAPFGLRRGALEALARDRAWIPSWVDPAVGAALRRAAAAEPEVVTVRVEAGDPLCTLEHPETRAVVVVHGGLDRDQLHALVERLRLQWAAEPDVLRAVDSLTVRVETAFC